MPGLYVITGSNGSGKSTLGFSHLPKLIRDNYSVFDGDKLAMQKRMELYKSITPSLKEANRLANEWLYEHFEELVIKALSTNDDFVYEGHLPNEENWETLTRFRKAGYKIHLIFFGLASTERSALRVAQRAKNGGHNVPPYEIERNFYGNLFQLNKKYEELDELKIVDTSIGIHKERLCLIMEKYFLHCIMENYLSGLKKDYPGFIKKLYKTKIH